jgi:hypothetical protein
VTDLARSTLDVCIASIQGQINSCATNDYSCLCTQYVNLITCYNNCPNDPNVGTAQQQRELNCNNASVYGSTTTYGTAAATSGAATATGTESASETAIQTGFGSATESDGSAATGTSDDDNGAAGVRVGMAAVAVAGLGMLL